jgi:hypothetical protein
MSARRFAILNGSTVIAAIMWDPDEAPDYVYPEPHTSVMEHPTASVGWSLVGSELVDPDPPPAPEPDPDPVPSDFPLTRRQIRGALILNGILDPDAWMQGVMASIPDPVTRALALNDWANAPVYDRDNPLFNDPSLIAAAGMTPAQVDALWMAAKDLPE